VVNGKIYLIGGAGKDNKPAGVQVYDPATGKWAARANMPTARGLFGTSAVGGTIYVVGGLSLAPDGEALGAKTTLPGIEVYTPALSAP
jgi:N-acetylneuraminic acid mutarotase